MLKLYFHVTIFSVLLNQHRYKQLPRNRQSGSYWPVCLSSFNEFSVSCIKILNSFHPLVFNHFLFYFEIIQFFHYIYISSIIIFYIYLLLLFCFVCPARCLPVYYAKLSVKVCDFVRILWDLFLRPVFVASSPGDRYAFPYKFKENVCCWFRYHSFCLNI